MAETPKHTNNSPTNTAVLIRKREQIKGSNKVLFIWVAVGSVIVSFSLVLSIFISKQLIFGEKVLMAKSQSIESLKKSQVAAKELNSNINELRADRNTLFLSRATSSKNNLDVILDALPYDGDRISFGSSLQKVLLTNVGVDTFSVEAESDQTEGAVDDTENALEPVGGTQVIPFNFELKGSPEQVNAVFEKLNKSIRPIKITSLTIESGGGGNLNMKVSAVTYYQEKKEFQLEGKTVKP